jgi:hypothetical protein
MNKSRTTITAVALALGLGGTSAFAQQKDLTVTLGLKVWGNTWESGQVNTGFVGGGSNSNNFTSGQEWSTIPSLTLKYKDWFISGSQFMKTSYNFPAQTSLGFAPAAAVATPNTQTLRADRKETDVNLGWYFVPQVAVTIGWKEIKQTYTSTFTPAAFAPFNTSAQTTTNEGITVGIQGSARIGNSGFFMYGNGASSLGNNFKAKFGGGNPNWDGWFASSELGFGYAFGGGVTATLGYKYQVLDFAATNTNQRGRDITTGFIGGVAYTF